MKREGAGLAPTVVVPGVVSLAASSRRTLKHGDTFAMFDELGDVVEMEHSPAGLFHCDTRHLSRLVFTLEGHRPLSLSSTVQPDNVVLDVDLTNPDYFREGELVLAKDTFHVARAKFLWQAGCYELLTVSSFAERARRVRVALDFGVDFADLFEIRGYPRRNRGAVRCARQGPGQVEFSYGSLDCVARSTRLCFSPVPAALSDSRAEFELELAPRERRALSLTVTCRHGPPPPAPTRFFTAMRRARGEATHARERMPSVETSNVPFNGVVSRSAADLAMLMSETPQGGYPYAGVPWFSTVFGRDGLITALETLWLDASVARGVLRFLAAHQGSRENPQADEEPGKIVHEMRESELARIGAVPFGRYFGSVDATPLFVALAGLYWKRSRDRETLEQIWPAVKAALAWIERDGDRDGDGFLEYDRRRSSGLRNQGWKDSDDAVFHADGRLAEGPIALCEVQGYVYLAKRLAAGLAADFGEPELSRRLEAEAGQLKERFEAAFWCESLGTYALALDGEKAPCCVRSSNAGQLLFTGLVPAGRAGRLVEGLFGRDFFTGWGIRTVSAREKRFNPASYHNGSVWPHDNALIGLGLSKTGRCSEALSLTSALFDAAAHMHLRRLPELFCGFERRRGKSPILYPVACAPQAWAACAPFALLQACLGLDIDAAAERLTLHRPRLPPFLDWMRVRRLRVGESRLDLFFRRNNESISVSLLGREGSAEVKVML